MIERAWEKEIKEVPNYLDYITPKQEIWALVFLGLIWLFTYQFEPHIFENIPTHFDSNMFPDAWQPKTFWNIHQLCISASIIYIIFTFTSIIIVYKKRFIGFSMSDDIIEEVNDKLRIPIIKTLWAYKTISIIILYFVNRYTLYRYIRWGESRIFELYRLSYIAFIIISIIFVLWLLFKIGWTIKEVKKSRSL